MYCHCTVHCTVYCIAIALVTALYTVLILHFPVHCVRGIQLATALCAVFVLNWPLHCQLYQYFAGDCLAYRMGIALAIALHQYSIALYQYYTDHDLVCCIGIALAVACLTPILLKSHRTGIGHHCTATAQ